MLRRDRAPIDIRRDAEPLPTPFEPHERILLYSGNLGVAHPIDVFCEAYRQHIQKGSNRVRLWMNGQGARINELRAYCATHGLPLYTSSPVPLSNCHASHYARCPSDPIGQALLGLCPAVESLWLHRQWQACSLHRSRGVRCGTVVGRFGKPEHRHEESVTGCFKFLEQLACSEKPHQQMNNPLFSI